MARPIISENEIKKFIEECFGLKQTNFLEFVGYDDRNFLIQVHLIKTTNPHINEICDSGYVFKVVNLADSHNELLFEGQHAVLLELERHQIPVPKPVLTVEGKPFARVKLTSGEHIVRLMEFIEGIPLVRTGKLTSDMCFQVGAMTGRINNALIDFQHPAYIETNAIKWSIASVSYQLNQHINLISDPVRKKLCQDTISEFFEKVMCKIKSLHTGMIHGDINEHNVVLRKSPNSQRWLIKGIIDYGDTHKGCYIFDLAIAMLYMILQSDASDGITNGGHVLAGYLSVRNVPEEELKLLPVCIRARLVQSLLLGTAAHFENPNNTYVLSTAVKGWFLLTHLEKQTEGKLITKWKNIVDSLGKNKAKVSCKKRKVMNPETEKRIERTIN